MANSFQQRALQRKIVYLTAVVVLFACSWLWRRHVVEAGARDLALLEETRGDADLGGATLRLSLTGMRGVVTCALWYQAQEQKKKNQWGDLERTVRTLTKLQPHFITPWLFQSWNLSWNVANESDRERDKYYYIVRGIQLLAVGERQNRFQPNLRHDLGMYHISRICKIDQNNVMRSLFQLSCIPPAERDPERLAEFDESGRIKRIKWLEFEAFCTAHPQLVRRLHTPPLPYDPRRDRKFRCPEAKHLVEFLKANQYVPTFYVDKGDTDWEQSKPKENELERFPILPPTRTQMFNPLDEEEYLTQEALANRGGIPDWLDGYYVARAWYGYAQEALPNPGKLPGDNAPIEDADRGRKRVNRHMRTINFRGSPSLAQTFIAERLQEEGWHDNERFLLTRWFPRNRFSGPKGEEGLGGPSEVGHNGPRGDWSVAAWAAANQAWQDFEKYNLLIEPPFQAEARRKRAEAFRKDRLIGPRDAVQDIGEAELKQNPVLKAQLDDYRFLLLQDDCRRTTNIDHFLTRSAVEKDKKTVTARKLIYRAEQQLAANERLEAMKTYEQPEALQGWREILERDDPVWKQFRANEFAQEWTFEAELKYMRLYRWKHEGNLTRDLALEAYLGQALAPSPLGADWALLGTYSRPQLLLLPKLDITGPFHRDSQGFPLIPQEIKDMVLDRRGLKRPPSPGQAPGQPLGVPVRPPPVRPSTP